MSRKTAIVTGGSRGIGRAICLELAAKDTNIVINYAGNQQAAEEVSLECKALGVDTLVVQGDVANPSDCDEIVKKAMETFSSVEILVNNAGITRDNLLMRMSESDFDDVINTNLKGTYNMMKAVCRVMMKQRYGRIVNISSVVGLMGNGGQVNYAASKAGIIGMTKSFAREIATRGITVNAVAPGFIGTDMTAKMETAAIENICSTIPKQTIGKPEDVAGAVGFFASENAGYITGQVLCVDGGMAMM